MAFGRLGRLAGGVLGGRGGGAFLSLFGGVEGIQQRIAQKEAATQAPITAKRQALTSRNAIRQQNRLSGLSPSGRRLGQVSGRQTGFPTIGQRRFAGGRLPARR